MKRIKLINAKDDKELKSIVIRNEKRSGKNASKHIKNKKKIWNGKSKKEGIKMKKKI